MLTSGYSSRMITLVERQEPRNQKLAQEEETMDRTSISEKASQRTVDNSNHSIQFLEESLYTLLNVFRFVIAFYFFQTILTVINRLENSSSVIYSLFYSVWFCGSIIINTWAACLPTSHPNEWIHITLQVFTILRTFGLQYITGTTWFYILPGLLIIQLMMISCMVLSYIFDSKGRLGWSTTCKKIMYGIGFVMVFSLYPLLHGVSLFINCNWSTGYLNRDSTMLCWNFTSTPSTVAIIAILLQVFLSCFFVIISFETNPRKNCSFFATLDNILVAWDILFSSATILLQEILQQFVVVIWLPYLLHIACLIISAIITIRTLPFYSRWTNAFYFGSIVSRILLATSTMIMLSIQANQSQPISSTTFAICLVAVIVVVIFGFLFGFITMICWEHFIIKVAKDRVDSFFLQEKPLVPVAQEEEKEISVQKLSTENAKWKQFRTTVQNFLVTLPWIELAIKIQFFKNNGAQLEQLFSYCERNNLRSASLQLYKGLYSLYFQNQTIAALQRLQIALYELKPNPFARFTILLQYFCINMNSKEISQQERASKLISAVNKLEVQLRLELKQLFTLYAQKSQLKDVEQQNDTVQLYFSRIRSMYSNLTRNYKLSRVYYACANFAEQFEKNSLKAMSLVEYAKQLEEEELKRKNQGVNVIQLRMKRLRLHSTISVGVPQELPMRGDSVQSLETLTREIDDLEEKSDDEAEETKEELYRSAISTQKSKLFYYLFIIGTALLPLLMILMFDITTVSISPALFSFLDVSHISTIPTIPLFYLRQVRMQLFFPNASDTLLNWNSLAAEKFVSTFDDVEQYTKQWSDLSATIAYPIIAPDVVSYYKYEQGSFLNLFKLFQQSMEQVTMKLQKENQTTIQVDQWNDFLFIWGNTHSMYSSSLQFMYSYLNLFYVSMSSYLTYFFSILGVVYLIRIGIVLLGTIAIGIVLFVEKHRVLQLLYTIPSEALLEAAKNIENKSSFTAVVARKSVCNSISIRTLIALIWAIYILIEVSFVAFLFGLFGQQIQEFPRDVELISNLGRFKAISNEMTFYITEQNYLANTSSLLQHSYSYSFSTNSSETIPTLFSKWKPSDLFQLWNKIINGDKYSASIITILPNSVLANTIWNGLPCNQTFALKVLEFVKGITCGISLDEIILEFISDTSRNMELVSQNILSETELLKQCYFSNAIFLLLDAIQTEVSSLRNVKIDLVTYSSVVAALFSFLISIVGIFYFIFWNRVLQQSHAARQLLLFINSDALDSVPAIREYIFRYSLSTLGQNSKKIIKPDKAASVIQAAIDSVLIVNSKSKITDMNYSCCKMASYASAELLGQSCKLLFGTDIVTLIEQVCLDKKPFTKELDLLKKDGTRVPMRVSGSLGDWNDQQMVCIFARDISLERKQNELVGIEKENNEKLLLNILPAHIAQRIRNGESQIAERFDDVTILFSDMCNFTVMSGNYTPIDLIKMLNDVVCAFDELSLKHKVEKIKTIGDAYMVVGGLTPISSVTHPQFICNLALDMLTWIREYNLKQNFTEEKQLQVRIGIHTGAISAGIIGKLKFTYDVFGDAINVASRMESHGIPMKIQISKDTFERVFDLYAFEERIVQVKGKGQLNTFIIKC